MMTMKVSLERLLVESAKLPDHGQHMIRNVTAESAGSSSNQPREDRSERSLPMTECADLLDTVAVARRRYLRSKALSTLSQKSATVAGNGDCRRKRGENGDSRRIRQQSHFFATVAVFGHKLSPKSATIVVSVDRL